MQIHKNENLKLYSYFNLSNVFITGNSTVVGFSSDNNNTIDGLVVQNTVKFTTETNTVKALMYAAKETGYAKWIGHNPRGYAQACNEEGNLITTSQKISHEVVLHEDNFKNWYNNKKGSFLIKREDPSNDLELNRIYTTYRIDSMGKF